MMVRIFVIDDDDLCAKVTRAKLMCEGYDATCHRGPFGALNALRRSDYDLIILDIKMPALDGRGVIKLIRMTPGLEHVKILFHSSLGSDELKRLAEDHGADGYISKSCSSQALAAKIKEVLNTPSRAGQGPNSRR
jgi:DNA-binding response OmpR family regulator